MVIQQGGAQPCRPRRVGGRPAHRTPAARTWSRPKTAESLGSVLDVAAARRSQPRSSPRGKTATPTMRPPLQQAWPRTPDLAPRRRLTLTSAAPSRPRRVHPARRAATELHRPAALPDRELQIAPGDAPRTNADTPRAVPYHQTVEAPSAPVPEAGGPPGRDLPRDRRHDRRGAGEPGSPFSRGVSLRRGAHRP